MNLVIKQRNTKNDKNVSHSATLCYPKVYKLCKKEVKTKNKGQKAEKSKRLFLVQVNNNLWLKTNKIHTDLILV